MKKHSMIKSSSLASEGSTKIAFAQAHMPVLTTIATRFSKSRPFAGWTIACCLHITKETAILVRTLAAGGASVVLTASNPLSTQDDVAAALVKEGFAVFGWKGMDSKSYYTGLNKTLDYQPDITIDDGCDLVFTAHRERTEVLPKIKGGCEETTTGIIRLRAMEKAGVLRYPIMAVNDALTKFLFDNRYGTGQSAIDGITRATNILWAGKTVVVVGYGWCGRGVAMRARGMGAIVIVTEVDPVRALEARMDGYEVLPIVEAARVGEVFITVTGNKGVITINHIKMMKNTAILANAGHFDVEIDVAALNDVAKHKKTIRPLLTQYTLSRGKTVYLVSEGRLANLAAAEGHPSEVMDTSFATQALSALYIRNNYKTLEPKVYKTTLEQDQEIAHLKLASLGITIDRLTPAQEKYLADWEQGTS